jgi:Ca-activated chloride channel family protein
MRGICVVIVAWLFVGWTGVGVAGAEDASKTLSPYFFVESGDAAADHFPLKSTSVEAVITGVIADVRVTQEYANMGAYPINARYIFPASTRAAVHGMRMTVGEEVIEARIQERQAAKKTFNDAKDAGKSASLLEQERPNVFSMHVANIMPGETVTIELHYSELLVPEEGTYEFVYPTVVGPRYSTIPEAGAADHHQWLKNPFLTEDRKPTSTFDIRVSLAAGMPIAQVACGSHATDVKWEDPSRARIGLAADETHGGDRDFILDYRLDGDRIQSGLILQKGGEENFFLLMVQPPQRVAPESMPPREYIFVLDVSGSMSGFPLDTAKLLMRQLLAGLRPVDRFNLILFAGSAQVLAPQSVPAESPHIQAAMKLVDHQQGGGGTELAQALKTGLALPRKEGCARTMVVVTDGYIAAEKEVFGLIAGQTGRCNVFAFGIGSSVNRYLIEGLARAGQGEPFVVTEPQAAAAAAARFKTYIEAPVLTGIGLRFDGFDAYAVEPDRPADLFARRPLIVCGKWRGRPQGTIELTGTTGEGPFKSRFDAARSAPSDDNSAIAYLWARMRLGRLTDFTSREDDAETREQVTQLGLRYHMLTAHTSFVAVHQKVRNTAAPARDVDQPLPLPHNVSNLAVGGRNVPEPGLGLLLAVTAAAALFTAWRKRRMPHGSS